MIATIGLSELGQRIKNTNITFARRLVLGIFTALFLLFLIPGKAGIRLNTTPSLPIGLYIAGTGQLVEFCPAQPYAAIAADRRYRSPGNCPDGASPLMKPVVAREGDTVELSAAGVAVNGYLLPNTVPLQTDTKGRPLEHWPFGIYRVPADTVWVASSYNPRSFDSRYFGPIRDRGFGRYSDRERRSRQENKQSV